LEFSAPSSRFGGQAFREIGVSDSEVETRLRILGIVRRKLLPDRERFPPAVERARKIATSKKRVAELVVTRNRRRDARERRSDRPP
jgi:hypothetical protein